VLFIQFFIVADNVCAQQVNSSILNHKFSTLESRPFIIFPPIPIAISRDIFSQCTRSILFSYDAILIFYLFYFFIYYSNDHTAMLNHPVLHVNKIRHCKRISLCLYVGESMKRVLPRYNVLIFLTPSCYLKPQNENLKREKLWVKRLNSILDRTTTVFECQ